MSWFCHVGVSQGSNQQPTEMTPADPMASYLSATPYSNVGAPPSPPDLVVGETVDTASHAWFNCSSSSPGPEDFPPAPQAAASSVPPRLESLSCTSLNAGGRDPLPVVSYVTIQEQRCVLSWFLGWSVGQRERFLQDLLGKAVPGKVCTLLESLNTLQVKDRPPNIFECQLRLWTQWFESWSEEERNNFLHILEERDPVFVAHFYRSVAGTAGRD